MLLIGSEQIEFGYSLWETMIRCMRHMPAAVLCCHAGFVVKTPVELLGCSLVLTRELQGRATICGRTRFLLHVMI